MDLPAPADPPSLLDETDLALVHALQVSPRASWLRVAEVLEVDPATVTRRWARLREGRLAWLTVWPAPDRLADRLDAAFVDLRCRPGQALAVARQAALRPSVVGAELVMGSADVSLFVIAEGLTALAAEVDEVCVEAGAAVIEVERQAVTVVHREDSQWRLRVLGRQGVRRLSDVHSSAAPRPPREEVLTELVDALADDVRLPSSALAQRLGVSETTARRVLHQAVRSGSLRLGCDVARTAVGAGRGAVLLADTDDPRQAAARISELPEVRRCAEVVGPQTLRISVAVRSLSDLAGVEEGLSAPGQRVHVRRRIALVSEVKRNVHLLAPDGLVERRINPW